MCKFWDNEFKSQLENELSSNEGLCKHPDKEFEAMKLTDYCNLYEDNEK